MAWVNFGVRVSGPGRASSRKRQRGVVRPICSGVRRSGARGAGLPTIAATQRPPAVTRGGDVEAVQAEELHPPRGLRRRSRWPSSRSRSTPRVRGTCRPCPPVPAGSVDRRPPPSAPSAPDSSPTGRRPTPESAAGRQPLRGIDRLVAGPLLSIDLSVIAQAIVDREAEIEPLRADQDADRHRAAPWSLRRAAARARRSSRSRTAAAESKSGAKPPRKRRPVSAAEKSAVSERMTAYWAGRRKKAAKE